MNKAGMAVLFREAFFGCEWGVVGIFCVWGALHCQSASLTDISPPKGENLI